MSSIPAATDVTPALASAASHSRIWLATVLGLIADLWSKAWVFESMTMGEHRTVIDGVLVLRLSYNKGALWGIGQGMGWLFIGASIFATIFVVYVFARSCSHQRSFHIGLGLVLAGALGNLYDRVTEGHVRDFLKLDIHLGEWDMWPWVFNGADVFLVVGVALLMINIWFDNPSPETPAGDDGPAAGDAAG